MSLDNTWCTDLIFNALSTKLKHSFINMNKKDFLNVIEEIVELDPGTLTGDEALADLEGWDSLSIVAFIAATDKHLGGAPPPSVVVSARTVADLVAAVEEKLSH